MIITPHFNSREMACHDGTPYPLDQVDEDDTQRRPWRITRLTPLFETLEIIRTTIGNTALIIDSGYRTLKYDQQLYDADAGQGNVAMPQGSQHPKGRAADIRHGKIGSQLLFGFILQLFESGQLPRLGGLGLYSNFVHVDVRPRKPPGHLAQWFGTRTSNVI